MTPVFKVSLFGDPRIEACLPAPRGLSQVTTSFIGSWCLGIHRSHLVACYFYKDARVHCVVLKMRAGPGSSPASPGQTLVRVEEGCKQPTLQDPTACLGQVTELNVPLLLAQVVLDELGFPASGQCSTFRCHAGTETFAPSTDSWTARLCLAV